MAKKTHFLVNPKSGGGSVGNNWESISRKIENSIGEFEFQFTKAKGEGSSLAKSIADSGCDTIVVIGGDGTVSEVVDGIMKSKHSKKVKIAILNLGTGGDFSKTLGVPGDVELALEKLQAGKSKLVDVGLVEYFHEISKSMEKRHFINITGCGMAGAVVRSVNRSSKRFGGFSYYLGSMGNVLSYKNKHIEMRLDDGDWVDKKITTIAICNGQYFGGGMRVSPNSELCDGFFDITLLNDWNFFYKAYYSKNFYNGTILTSPGVESYRCKKVEIRPVDGQEPAIIDCDGEDIGLVPMTVEVIPSAVQFIV
ncbi:MAG: diacylglycerol kinase family lipid kinase [Leptospira sp.]|nr:diacylglycerol kinase family lipid kinase [Leptospira sp.]